MKSQKSKTNLLAVIMAALVLFVAAPAVQAIAAAETLPSGIETEALPAKIDAFVEEHADTTAGMAVAVFDEDHELYRAYFGDVDLENQIPVTEDSVFEWGSATKLLVWVSVMQLYEAGALDLNADIQTYLPDGFLTNLSFSTPVAMTHLMSHTAGFQEGVVDLFLKDETYVGTLAEMLQAHEPAQIYEPGTVTAYSNWGSALAAYIVERVSGQDFSDYVHTHIFAPLSMTKSAVAVDLSDTPYVSEKRRELQCYTADKALLPDCFYYITLYPAGMCTSTLTDFEHFGRAMLTADTRLLSRRTWEEMRSPLTYFGQTNLPKNCHGLWMVPFGVQTLGHGGNTAGCSSYLLFDPVSGIGMVIMTNQQYEEVYNTKLPELIFGAYDPSAYGIENVPVDGVFRTGRTVRKGPTKFLSLSYLLQQGEKEEDDQELWVYDDSQTPAMISFPYADYQKIPTALFVFEVTIVFCWAGFLIFSVLSLLIRGILALRRRKKKAEVPAAALSKWSLLAAVLQLLTAGLFFYAVAMISAYAYSGTYMFSFALLGVMLLMMCGMAGYAFAKHRHIKGMTTARRGYRLYLALTAAGLFVTVLNLWYWELYQFWTL